MAILSKSTALKVATTTPVVLKNKDERFSVEELSASAVNSGALEENKKSSYPSSIIPITSIIFIGAGAGAVYFIRRKKVISKTGSDFEILDE